MMFLPKYSCVLSPIERFWAMLKNQWKRQIASYRVRVNEAGISAEVHKALQVISARVGDSDLESAANKARSKIMQGELV